MQEATVSSSMLSALMPPMLRPISALSDEEGVRRQLEGLRAVWLQSEGPPDAADRVVAQPAALDNYGP